jgi:hypothetical protein
MHPARFFTISLLLALALSASSCSWETDFVVVNATKSPVLVVYRLKKSLVEAPYNLVWPPEIAEVSESERDESWQPAEPKEANQTVTVQLPPNHALRIARMNNYTRPKLSSWAEFPIEEIEVKTAKGNLRYCGTSLLLAFEGARFRQDLKVTGTPRQIRSSTC